MQLGGGGGVVGQPPHVADSKEQQAASRMNTLCEKMQFSVLSNF